MKIKHRNRSQLAKRAKRGFRGYPVATIAFYGPTAERASKVTVGIVTREGAETDILETGLAKRATSGTMMRLAMRLPPL